MRMDIFCLDFTWRVDVSPLWTEAAEQRSEVPCPICGKTFKTRGSLASHKYAYHRDVSNTVHNPPPPPNPIQLLDFQMDTNFESKDRDIECPICHKFFSTKGSLATHKYNYHRNASTLQWRSLVLGLASCLLYWNKVRINNFELKYKNLLIGNYRLSQKEVLNRKILILGSENSLKFLEQLFETNKVPNPLVANRLF